MDSGRMLRQYTLAALKVSMSRHNSKRCELTAHIGNWPGLKSALQNLTNESMKRQRRDCRAEALGRLNDENITIVEKDTQTDI